MSTYTKVKSLYTTWSRQQHAYVRIQERMDDSHGIEEEDDPGTTKAKRRRCRQYEFILMQMGQRVRFVPFTLERLESDLLEDKALDSLRREGRSGTSHSSQNREKSET